MLPFRLLAQIADADLPVVGEKAMALRHLQRLGLPTVAGGVILSDAWTQRLQGIVPAVGEECLRDLDLAQPQRLRQTAQMLRHQLLDLPLAFDLAALLEQVQAPWLMLRPSVFLAGQDGASTDSAADLLGLVAAHPCAAQPQAVAAELKQLWSESLRASTLMVWRRQCQRLDQVRLATLVQPLYPAEVSGTLVIGPKTFALEVVLGLGQVLSAGEAVPARCQGSLLQRDRLRWQSGYQDRVYRLRLGRPGGSAAGLRVQQRQDPELISPLTPAQVRQLLHWGQQVQLQWGPAVRLEWLLYRHPQTGDTQLTITQACRWEAPEIQQDTPEPLAAQASLSLGELTEQGLTLPQIRGVVQGIGAAAGQVMAAAVVLSAGTLASELSLTPGCIVVLPDLQPEMCLRLQGVAGIVTIRGGATCHAAILARELGIPAVVGAPQATDLIQTGDWLWLDGDRGLVHLLPENPVHRPPAQVMADPTADLFSERLMTGSTTTQVMVNLSQGQRLGELPLEQSDGVGLLRSEWLLIDWLEGRHPQDWVTAGYSADLQARLEEKLAPILAAFAPKPVRYRSLDLRSQSWSTPTDRPPAEPNPMLGIRGTFSYQLDPRLFKLELAALAALQRQGHTNLQLMLPFVRTVEEFSLCRQWVDQAGLFQTPAFQLWIMAEVPSVLFLLPAYRQAGVQGIAIGTNDLTQLLLAVDRDQPIMASTYDERHPAVMAALAHLVQTARQQGLACSICGQAPVRHPELIAALVQWGISSISVEPGALAATRRAVMVGEQRQ